MNELWCKSNLLRLGNCNIVHSGPSYPNRSLPGSTRNPSQFRSTGNSDVRPSPFPSVYNFMYSLTDYLYELRQEFFDKYDFCLVSSISTINNFGVSLMYKYILKVT